MHNGAPSAQGVESARLFGKLLDTANYTLTVQPAAFTHIWYTNLTCICSTIDVTSPIESSAKLHLPWREHECQPIPDVIC